MKTRTEAFELGVACIVVAYEVATRMGWSSANLAPLMPMWIRIGLPCALLLPMRPREATYWLDRVLWAVAIGLSLNDNALPSGFWIVRVILWLCLGGRAARALWKHTQVGTHA